MLFHLNCRWFNAVILASTYVWFVCQSHAMAQRVTYEREPIDYLNAKVNDRVAQLESRLQSGDVKLNYDPQYGYLKSLLKELEVPLSSQSLVFSKTSLQLSKISPRRPRALYFNDDVYVGYCQRGDAIEIAATDAKQGATFYTLEQDAEKRPRFVRDKGGCLSCHASSRTQGIPGYLVRSVFPDAAGRPKLGSGTFTTDHTSPFEERWGGWYVTGSHGEMRHMGNTICKGDETTFDRDAGAGVLDLSDHFRTDVYLTPHSDIVALMVLEHQTQMHNAIAAANYETRLALHQSFQMNELLERPEGFVSDSAKRRIDAVTDDLLYYLLFCEEFRLTDPVSGPTSFATDFQSRGKRDSQGRTLRELDLSTRLLKYPCSYLIHSDAFAGIPDVARHQVLTKLAAILNGRNRSDEYDHLSSHLRREIAEILRDTLPEYVDRERAMLSDDVTRRN
ncbi:hypothetical protein [Roseiconus lacunae]|uniref:Cytochrome c domain-containing protein n=1 Tax=Roseiconus lacunae TaxID=2605694 RepID=A0ABT7PEI9_9BACT|nr:hypothetical protein [Roseiconus lacunae]MDM4014909.1 hypothetical protein [Roseiconus lacunae]